MAVKRPDRAVGRPFGHLDRTSGLLIGVGFESRFQVDDGAPPILDLLPGVDIPARGAVVGAEGSMAVDQGGEYCSFRTTALRQCSHTTTEGLIGGVAGALASPAALLLARYDAVGHLRLIARSTPLPTAVRREVAHPLHPAGPDHPWHGRRFSAAWGTRGELEYHPVPPGGGVPRRHRRRRRRHPRLNARR